MLPHHSPLTLVSIIRQLGLSSPPSPLTTHLDHTAHFGSLVPLLPPLQVRDLITQFEAVSNNGSSGAPAARLLTTSPYPSIQPYSPSLLPAPPAASPVGVASLGNSRLLAAERTAGYRAGAGPDVELVGGQRSSGRVLGAGREGSAGGRYERPSDAAGTTTAHDEAQHSPPTL